MQKCVEHKQLLIVLQHGLKAEKKVLRDDTFCIEAERERALELLKVLEFAPFYFCFCCTCCCLL